MYALDKIMLSYIVIESKLLKLFYSHTLVPNSNDSKVKRHLLLMIKEINKKVFKN